MAVYVFNNKVGKVEVSCLKVSENGAKVGVYVTIVQKVGNETKIYPSIRARKSDLLKNGTKLKNDLTDLDIEFTDDEIQNIISKAILALSEKAQEDSEMVDFIEMLRIIKEEAEENPSVSMMYVGADNHLYILESRTKEIVERFGWKALDFKRQLRNMGVLEISKDRPFGYKMNNPRVGDEVGKEDWYLKIGLKVKRDNVISIEDSFGGKVA